MLFSDYIGDPVIRSLIGIFYISVIVGFAIVHLAPLFYDSFKKIYRSCRRYFYRRKLAKSREKLVTNGKDKEKTREET